MNRGRIEIYSPGRKTPNCETASIFTKCSLGSGHQHNHAEKKFSKLLTILETMLWIVNIYLDKLSPFSLLTKIFSKLRVLSISFRTSVDDQIDDRALPLYSSRLLESPIIQFTVRIYDIIIHVKSDFLSPSFLNPRTGDFHFPCQCRFFNSHVLSRFDSFCRFISP
jgi:hypothetical protein